MKKPLIEFRDVTKRFDGRTILEKVNLKIFEGEVTTIIGKSGTGKTVLLKHIIGLHKPDEGDILFQGIPIRTMSPAEHNAYGRQISYMFQNNALFDSLTVFENIALPLRQTTNLNDDEIRMRVVARMKQAELMEMANKYPSELSGGMQKRVALSRAMVTDPKIVLFDEPTTGQDLIRRNAILSMIADYQKKFRFTAVLISHDLPDVFFISNRILVLHEGGIIFQGPPEELETFEHPFLDEFIQSLEGFQEHLTGLYSRRNFKFRYQNMLGRRHPDEAFTLVVFTLKGLDQVSEHLGHTAMQRVLKAFGTYIDKHCGAVGGFAARQARDQFVALLPFSDLSEAEQIIKEFSRDLHGRGLCEFQTHARLQSEESFHFSVLAGVAEGKPSDDINRVFDEALAGQRPMARFWCKTRG